MENVDQDRRHAIDAAIVRTMKSRKVLQHQQVRSRLAFTKGKLLKPSCMHPLEGQCRSRAACGYQDMETGHRRLSSALWTSQRGMRWQLRMHQISLVFLCWRSHLVWLLQLVLEVVQQLQRMFQPDIKQIKKRIEDLIQREFLVRSCCWDPKCDSHAAGVQGVGA